MESMDAAEWRSAVRRGGTELATRSAFGSVGRVGPVGTGFVSSAQVWLLLVALLALVRLYTLTIGVELQSDSRSALFDWPFVVVFGVLGLIGVWFAHRTGFPAALDPRIGNRQRFLVPVAAGLGVGLVLVLQEMVTGGIQLFLNETGLPRFNAPLPGAVLFYAGGAIIVEVIYRLLTIPVLLWLISGVLLRGRGQAQVFWALAAITSLIEPVTQEVGLLAAGLVGAFALHFATGYVFNFAQAAAFRRYGFLSAIALRWAAYLVWHIGYGNLICQC
jgi:hypothetical protein